MDSKKVARLDRASATNKVEIDTIYLNPMYDIKVYLETSTPTGLLTVGKLIPRVAGLPWFSFRWDDKPHTVDVDINGVSEKQVRSFKDEVNGYQGHHTIRVINSDNRIYGLDIIIPQIKIFEGRLKVCLEFSCSSNFSAKSQCLIFTK